MSRYTRFFWFFALMFFTTGCSGYRVDCKSLSDLSSSGNSDFSCPCDIGIGEKVRVNLVNGQTIQGKIQDLSPYGLELLIVDDDFQTQFIGADEILSIEKKQDAVMRTGMVILGIGAILGIVAHGFANMDLFQ